MGLGADPKVQTWWFWVSGPATKASAPNSAGPLIQRLPQGIPQRNLAAASAEPAKPQFLNPTPTPYTLYSTITNSPTSTLSVKTYFTLEPKAIIPLSSLSVSVSVSVSVSLSLSLSVLLFSCYYPSPCQAWCGVCQVSLLKPFTAL